MKNKLTKQIQKLLRDSPDNKELRSLLTFAKDQDHDSIRDEAKRIQDLLRAKKYTFEVEHVRPLENFGAITEKGLDSLLSRAEFYTALHSKSCVMEITPSAEEREKKIEPKVFYGRFVKSTGGFTKVTITKEDGSTIVRKYNHGLDNFCKPLGFIRAVSKALGKEIAIRNK